MMAERSRRGGETSAAIDTAGLLSSLDRRCQARLRVPPMTDGRRDVAYKDYLNAANRYFYAWNSLASAPKPVPVDTVATKMVELLNARYEYQGQVNEVFVYGSQEAWTAHEGVARTLPPSVAGSTLPDFTTAKPDPAAFGTAFDALLEVRCKEVTAALKKSCS